MKKIVYVDMDGVLVQFPSSLEEVDPWIRQECENWCNENDKHYSDFEGLFATLKPREGAIDAIEKLIKHGYKVLILSTAPWANTTSWTQKRLWVKRFLPSIPADDDPPEFPRKHLILTHRKDLNRGDYLIDDRPNNGAREFGAHEGQEWIHFGSDKFPDWESVLDYLLKQEA